jgi:type II secretory pathway component PulF
MWKSMNQPCPFPIMASILFLLFYFRRLYSWGQNEWSQLLIRSPLSNDVRAYDTYEFLRTVQNLTLFSMLLMVFERTTIMMLLSSVVSVRIIIGNKGA